MLNNQSASYTFREAHYQISRLAGAMKMFGVKKGDRVIVYMPMVPEGLFSMLATARLGAIHSVVFGGFSATELASRIIDCKPTLIVCGSCGYEPKMTVDYKQILDDALEICDKERIPKLSVLVF
jgi:propionyl-CoA synthetase